MVMIKLSNDIPFVNTKRMFVAFPNFNGEHAFDLSDYDMLIYYHKLFENRTNEDKSYIDNENYRIHILNIKSHPYDKGFYAQPLGQSLIIGTRIILNEHGNSRNDNS